MDWAGRNVSDLIKSNLLTSNRERIISQENIDFLKEQAFFHYLDGNEGEMQKYSLPDGEQVELSYEKSLYPDYVFSKRG